jgi:hypothetical protein
LLGWTTSAQTTDGEHGHGSVPGDGQLHLSHSDYAESVGAPVPIRTAVPGGQGALGRTGAAAHPTTNNASTWRTNTF